MCSFLHVFMGTVFIGIPCDGLSVVALGPKDVPWGCGTWRERWECGRPRVHFVVLMPELGRCGSASGVLAEGYARTFTPIFVTDSSSWLYC